MQDSQDTYCITYDTNSSLFRVASTHLFHTLD